MIVSDSVDAGAADKVLVAGDVHGNLARLLDVMRTAARLGITRVVQVGDFWIYDPQELVKFRRAADSVARDFGVRVTVDFVDGNHEGYNILDPSADGPVEFVPGLVYHPRGTTWEFGGRTFGAFGGAVSTDQQWRTEGKNWWATEVASVRDYRRALHMGRVDVLVSHDVPQFAYRQLEASVTGYRTDEDSWFNRCLVADVVAATRPSLVVHGHFHEAATGHYDLDGNNVDVVSLHRCDDWGALHSGEHVRVVDLSDLSTMSVPDYADSLDLDRW